ncbi:hypothetical protein PHPALM_30710 [Phytophthora palmivora]|uniref:ATP-binding cassette (ABC) Superfamily n=1 Tax=Phytophthora palmivora TaxID=4796 RepID=A0A2P4X4H7_9STRA|nr:hypothetical protein PHPALM_30710 [Phytophthora palmivora]
MGAYERHLIKGVPLFIENIETARSPPRVGISLGAAGEYLLSCTGRWVPHTGCPVKDLQAEAQLEFILIQQDLRVQFAHLVVKRQLVTEMEMLRSSTQPSSHGERGAQQPSGSLPGAGLPAPINSVKWDIPTTSLAAGAPRSASALGQPAPHGSGARRSDQGGQEELLHCIKPAIEYMRLRLHYGLGGLAAAQFGKPTALDVLRQDVDALGHETRELHGRVNRRVPASAFKGLRRSLDALAYEAHGQMPFYGPQWYSPHSAYGYSS